MDGGGECLFLGGKQGSRAQSALTHTTIPSTTANSSALKPQDLIVFFLSSVSLRARGLDTLARAGRIVFVIGVRRVGIIGEHFQRRCSGHGGAEL